MSMYHKAYVFDWRAFERDELYPLLLAALTSSNAEPVAHYIDRHRREICDPYEGLPIALDWSNRIQNRDVQELGDFALTRFYDASKDRGLASDWRIIGEHRLTERQWAALLGEPLRAGSAFFDPGRIGSYFQTPEQVITSHTDLFPLLVKIAELQPYLELLSDCARVGQGVYVTF